MNHLEFLPIKIRSHWASASVSASMLASMMTLQFMFQAIDYKNKLERQLFWNMKYDVSADTGVLYQLLTLRVNGTLVKQNEPFEPK